MTRDELARALYLHDERVVVDDQRWERVWRFAGEDLSFPNESAFYPWPPIAAAIHEVYLGEADRILAAMEDACTNR